MGVPSPRVMFMRAVFLAHDTMRIVMLAMALVSSR